ncbi:hypothetical protein PC116_g28193 [Phytophthora cactorum]|nr:hypothetical protein PC120_g26095 [Phytophthora cactorum]KAG4040023.1 hypothetical protein PC123_g24432 [Phytophthora cactorum]KAG4223340.1 hypothetical protein PC116_g28193 [Phytophthora cactorum]
MSSSSSWPDNRRQVKSRLNRERRSTRLWGLRQRQSQDSAKEWCSLWIRLVLRYNLWGTLEVTFQWSRLRTRRLTVEPSPVKAFLLLG